MPTFTFTHDGKEFDVTADTPSQAAKDFQAYRQDQMDRSYNEELKNTPPWQQIGKLGADALRTAINVPTLGYADNFADYMQGTGDLEQMKTKTSRQALGWGAPAIEVGTAAATIPTVVPRAIAAMGGGPAARTITGALTGGAEGATIGGISAAGNDQDPAAGGAWGGITGMLGQLGSSAINKGKRIFDEKVLGKTFEAPKYNITQLPPRPTPQQQVNVAANVAGSKSRLTSDPAVEQMKLRSTFENLQRTSSSKAFKPAEKAQMNKIIEGDPATTSTGILGDYLSNKMVSAASAIPGFGSGSYLAGLLAPPALLTAGRGLKEISAGGTREAVRDMRRMMYPNIESFKPPTNAGDAAKFANALRQLGISIPEMQ